MAERMGPPQGIPVRTSSQRALIAVKKLRKRASDLDKECAEQRSQEAFQRKHSGGVETFHETEEAKNIRACIQTYESQSALYREQEDRLANSNFGPEPIHKTSFWKASLPSIQGEPLGLPKIDLDDSTQLREDAKDHYGVKPPDGRHKQLWDAISGTWREEVSFKCAHIFPFRGGPEFMRSIFPGCDDDLNSVRNVMMMRRDVEGFFDKHLIALVPAVGVNASRSEIEEWHASEPKTYHAKVMEPDSKDMKSLFSAPDEPTEITWAQRLDGREVSWKNSARPRARFLYFHFLVGLVKKHRAIEDATKLPRRKEEVFWGTVGKWFKRSQLAGVVEMIGHDFEFLFPPDDVVVKDDDSDDNTTDYTLAWTLNEASKVPSMDEGAEDETCLIEEEEEGDELQ